MNKIIPSITVPVINKGITSKVILSDELKDKKVIIFGVPGAFTPTCSEKHMPSYIKLHTQLIDKGIDDIYCLSVNDSFVMNAWLLSYTDGNKIIGIADGNGEIAKSLDLLTDKSKNYMGMRSVRFAMIVIDNIIQEKFIEDSGEYQKTSAENLLIKFNNY
jgi:peroxiredoxin